MDGEQRDEHGRRSVSEAVLRLETCLLGHPAQPESGAIPRIEAHLKDQAERLSELEKMNIKERLGAMEGNILKATVGVIAALFGMVWQLIAGGRN